MMAEVLNTRLLYGTDSRKEAFAGDPVPSELSAADLAWLHDHNLIVDEADFVDDGNRPWAVENVSPAGDVHGNQGLNPAQPGDTETPQWQDEAVANEPTTVVPGTAPTRSETSPANPAISPGVAAVQEALAQAQPVADAPDTTAAAPAVDEVQNTAPVNVTGQEGGDQ